MNFLALIPNWLKFAAGGLVALVIVAGASYAIGKREGRSSAAADALAQTLKVLKSREDTNANISSADAAHLCAYFGLQNAERVECMRRVAEANAEAGHGSEDHH